MELDKKDSTHTPQTPSAPPPIKLSGVSFEYGPGLPALENLDFSVQEGEFLGLIGPNGGGKSTLLKMIIGLLAPQKGQVQVLGQTATALGRDRRLLGYVPQDTDVRKGFPATVLDVALMGTYVSLGIFRRPGRKEIESAREAIAETGLSNFENRLASQLSGGQQQRLSIARALVTRPRILLLDEPTSGLDTGGQAQLFALLERLRERYQLTVIMASHDVTALAHYANQLACINRTLHWHDRSELISEAVLRKVYACELDAFFISHRQHLEEFHGDHAPAGHVHGPNCTHSHNPEPPAKP